MSDEEIPVILKPEGNGPMEEPQHVDWRSKFRSGRRGDERVGALIELLASNKNNPTKARIPNVFGMCTVRLLGAWASATKEITYVGNGEPKTVSKTVSGLETFFYDNYNTISQSYIGKSREEYTFAFGALAQLMNMEEDQKGKRITDEGARKK